jgi:hypothetical protein
MSWFVYLPIGLGIFIAVAEISVTLLVARGERRRVLRNAAPSRKIFRPMLIQGGKAQAPPDAQGDDAKTKIA